MFKMSVECKNRSESDLGIEVEFEYPFRYDFAVLVVHHVPNAVAHPKEFLLLTSRPILRL